MRYPDGQEIRIGDLIWWDEGHHVGYVNEIRSETCSKESNFIVIGRHPFRADYHGYADGETQFFEHELVDDGIGRLSDVSARNLNGPNKLLSKQLTHHTYHDIL